MRVYFDFNDWWIGYYRGPNHHYVCPVPSVVLRWQRKSPWDCTCMTDPGRTCPVHEDPTQADEQAQVQIAYDALHDATCVNHGDHCKESEAQLKDAIRVMLWRLDEEFARD